MVVLVGLLKALPPREVCTQQGCTDACSLREVRLSEKDCQRARGSYLSEFEACLEAGDIGSTLALSVGQAEGAPGTVVFGDGALSG